MREILPRVLALRFPELYFCLCFHVSLLLPTSVCLISVKNTHKKRIFRICLTCKRDGQWFMLILHIWSVPNWDKVRDHTQTSLIFNTNLFGIFFRLVFPHAQNIKTEQFRLRSSRIPQVGHCCLFQTKLTQSQTLHVSGCHTTSHFHQYIIGKDSLLLCLKYQFIQSQ